MPNHFSMTGFTSKDGAELRFTPTGAAVVNFRMTGTHQRWDRDQGKHIDVGEPLWLGVSCWHELAEQVAEQIGQGTSRLVTVTGHLQRRSWQTPEGETRTADEITAASVCVHPPRDGQPAQRQQGGQQQPAQGGNSWGGQPQQADPWAGQQAGIGGSQTGAGGWGGGNLPAGTGPNDQPPFAA